MMNKRWKQTSVFVLSGLEIERTSAIRFRAVTHLPIRQKLDGRRLSKMKFPCRVLATETLQLPALGPRCIVLQFLAEKIDSRNWISNIITLSCCDCEIIFFFARIKCSFFKYRSVSVVQAVTNVAKIDCAMENNCNVNNLLFQKLDLEHYSAFVMRLRITPTTLFPRIYSTFFKRLCRLYRALTDDIILVRLVIGSTVPR